MTRCEAQGKIKNTYKNIERIYRLLKTHERELDNKRALILHGLERILFIVNDDPQYKEGIEKLDDDGYRAYANMLTNFYNQMMRNNSSNIYHPNIKSQPYFTVAPPPLTPPIPFKNMTPQKQMEHIKKMYIEGEEKGGQVKGVAAACIRSLREDMKLEGLFAIDPIFMNKDLRDFLNVNQNGEDYYNFAEVTTSGSGWSEMFSWGARYHQNEADNSKGSMVVDYVVNPNKLVPVSIGVYNRLNAKFTHLDGREAVFGYPGEGRYINIGPDRGTFNYSDGALFTILDHQTYDVDPFEKYPPTGYDPTTQDLFNRYRNENSYYWKY